MSRSLLFSGIWVGISCIFQVNISEIPAKPSEETTSEDTSGNTAASNDENDPTLTGRLNMKLLSSLLERLKSGTQFDRVYNANLSSGPGN
jgi:hypothetical protein